MIDQKMIPIVIALVVIIATVVYYFYTQISGLKSRLTNLELIISKQQQSLLNTGGGSGNNSGSNGSMNQSQQYQQLPAPVSVPGMGGIRSPIVIQQGLPPKSPTPVMNLDVEQLNPSDIQKALQGPGGHFMGSEEDDNVYEAIEGGGVGVGVGGGIFGPTTHMMMSVMKHINTLDLASNFAKSMQNHGDEDDEEMESQTDDIFAKKPVTGTEKIDQILGESESASPPKSGIKVFLMTTSVGGDDNDNNNDYEQQQQEMNSKKSVKPVVEDVGEGPKTPDLLTEDDLRNMHIHELKDLSKKYGLKSNQRWKKNDYIREIMTANTAKIQEVRSMKNVQLSHVNQDDEMDLDDDGGDHENEIDHDEIIPSFGDINQPTTQLDFGDMEVMGDGDDIIDLDGM